MDEKNIISLIGKYLRLELSTNTDYDKFNQYAITHHSATIEGSTLTEIETRLLLDEGLTPKGKPLLHSLMVQDHYRALLFILQAEREKRPVTVDFIKQINAAVMKQTGSVYNTVFGQIDSSKGLFRKGNVSAGNTYFVNFDKVDNLVKKLCEKINERIPGAPIQQLNTSIDAHFDLVTIHPFYDGNGRTSRLLMDYLQLLAGLPMAIVFKEDKAEYFEALVQTRKKEDITIFRNFMFRQYAKYLQQEIVRYEDSQKPDSINGIGYSLVF